MFDYFLFLSEHIFGETHSSVAKYMNFSYLCNPVGFGGGMVDTRDLKSLGQECLYGFESRPKHQQQFSGVAAFFSPKNSQFFRNTCFGKT